MSKTDDSKKTKTANQRRANGASSPLSARRGRPQAMEARPGTNKSSSRRVREITTSAIEAIKPILEQGATQDNYDHPGNHSGSGDDHLPVPRGRKMSYNAKVKALTVLRIVNAIGIVLIIGLTFLVLANIQSNQNTNHRENAINQSEMICLLKVLPSQRTTAFQDNCLKLALESANR